MSKQSIIYILLVVVSVGAAFGAQQYVHKARLSRIGQPATGLVSPTPASDESLAPDYSDDRILLGHTHNAFVGKVLRRVGSLNLVPTSDPSFHPSSQYEVDVLLNIKGNLHEKVVVNQFEFDTPLLQVGSTYLFAARYFRKENLYSIVYSPYEYQLLTSDASLSVDALTTLASNNDRVKALQAAYPNEQLSPFDIRFNDTLNSYQSRRYDANGQLIEDTVELAQGRSVPSVEPVSPTPSPSPVAASSTANPRDSQRVRDLNQIQLALEQYFDKEPQHRYPISLDALVPKYISELPRDPSSSQAYRYAVDSTGLRYNLAAALEDLQSPSLAHDLDGVQHGINCDDPVYCVGS